MPFIKFFFLFSQCQGKGMRPISQKKGKKCLKRAKYLKIWVIMYKIWKNFEKGQVTACDYRTQ